MIRHRHTILAAVAAAALVAGAATAASPAGHASLVIRHQTHGCHSWSLNGGAFTARQSVALPRGASISVVNNDVMPHKLVETSGPAVRVQTASMSHIGATAKISFARAGVYRFTTKVGEDYMAGVKTTGEDNVLRLTVTVS
jgi:plastocyanin